MRKLAPLLVLFPLASVNTMAAEPALAPDWTLTATDGSRYTLSDEIARQTTVLLFWATWCPYCRALMPHLQSIRLEHSDDVKILALNFHEDGDPAAYIYDAGFDFVLLPEADAVAESYGITGTPGVLIVDRERRIRFDLRELPRVEPPDNGKEANHRRRAAYCAPYWAAEIRKAIDTDLAERGRFSD